MKPLVPLRSCRRQILSVTAVFRGIGLALFLGVQLSSARAALASVLGHYVGAWTNLTFNSTGKAIIDISLASPTTARIVFDMDGFVFGAFNPPPITMPGAVNGDQIQIDNQGVGSFGDIKGLIDSQAGTFSVGLTNIPGGFISYITADGSVTGGHMQLRYVVHFPGPASPTNPANGLMDVRTIAPIVIQTIDADGNQIALSWTGTGGSYQIQSRPDLGSGSWVNLGNPTLGTFSTVTQPGAHQFYRVIIP